MSAASLMLAMAMTAGASPDSTGWDEPLTIARCPYESPSLPADAETALNATLLVRVPNGTGSAVLISPDGFALTAAHVVGDNETVGIIAHGGAKLEAVVVRVDEAQDSALLKVDMEGSSPCLQPLDGQATLGSDIYIFGSPAGEELSFSVSKGVVSGYRTFDDMRFVQLDASVNPGNSGGPAVDALGHIVGIASWKVSDVSMEGLAFAVPTDVALHALWVELGDHSDEDWAERGGRANRPQPEVPGGVTPDPSPVEAFDPAQVRRGQLRRGFITAGAVLLGTGVPFIAGTAIAYRRQTKGSLDRLLNPGWTQRRWKVVRGLNTFGWTMSIGGAAMLVAGLVIPKKVKKRNDNDLSLHLDSRGLSVSGRF